MGGEEQRDIEAARFEGIEENHKLGRGGRMETDG